MLVEVPFPLKTVRQFRQRQINDTAKFLTGVGSLTDVFNYFLNPL